MQVSINELCPAWYLRFPSIPSGTPDFSVTGCLKEGEHLVSEEPAVSILFEGYLYDQKQYTRELDRKYVDVNDGRLVTHLYGRFGEQIFSKLRGRYLIAIYDRQNDVLLIGHDAMGLHPVYYALTSVGLVCSSNIYSLAYSGLIDRQPDVLSVALSTTISHPPLAGRTHFKHIKRLRPGCYLRITKGGQLAEVRFWEMFSPAQGPVTHFDTAYQCFESCLARAVERCTARNPKGILLSGGMDSISIAGLASKFLPDASTLVACMGKAPPSYPGPEAVTQDAVTEYLGMTPFSGSAKDWLGGSDLYTEGFSASKYFPCPLDFWWAGITVNFYNSIVNKGVNSVLTGSGGDEQMGVHSAHAADLIRSMSFYKLYLLVKSVAKTGNFGWYRACKNVLKSNGVGLLLKAYSGQKGVARLLFNTRAAARKQARAWMVPDRCLAEEFFDVLEQARFGGLDRNGKVPDSFYHSALQHNWENLRMFWEFERQFHLGRNIGLDFLHPFHDQDFVEFCSRLSPGLFFRDGLHKSMLRPLVESLFPDLLIHKQRKYQGDKQDFLKDQVNSGFPINWAPEKVEYLTELGVVDRGCLPGATDMNISYPDKVLLTNLLNVEHWCQRHFN